MMDGKEKAFDRARKKAENVARNPEKVKKILDSAMHKSAAHKNPSQFQEISEKFQALIRLVRSWINREYQVIPWQTILLAITAIVYFVSPFDAIFDFIPLLGLADDVAILTAVLSSINHDLDKFMTWENEILSTASEAAVPTIEADYEEVGGERQK